MGDQANQVGKTIKNTGVAAATALKRYLPKPIKIERVRDIFDPLVPFEMEFNTSKNETTVLLNLYFNGPPPSNCCSNNLCSVCEVFADGNESIQLTRGYISGSVLLYIKGVQRTAFVETSPSTGTVTLTTSVAVGDIVRVCYVYSL